MAGSILAATAQGGKVSVSYLSSDPASSCYASRYCAEAHSSSIQGQLTQTGEKTSKQVETSVSNVFPINTTVLISTLFSWLIFQ